jgi:hypothetical protein
MAFFKGVNLLLLLPTLSFLIPNALKYFFNDDYELGTQLIQA